LQKFFRSVSIVLLFLSVPFLAALGIFSNFLPNSFMVEDEAAFFKVGDYPVHVQTGILTVTEAEKSLTSPSGRLEGNVMLGPVPIKKIDLQVEEEKEVLVSGRPFGIKLFTEGVLVVGTGEVETKNGAVNPGDESGLLVGDILMALNNQKISSNEETAKIIENCNGKTIHAHFIRNGVEMDVILRPVKSILDGRYKAGLWVRDSTAGIGTLTFVESGSGAYAGLGHGVCDVDTGKLMPLSDGEIVPVTICGITKGLPGSAGELLGFFSEERQIGTLERNTSAGVYGRLRQSQGKGTPMKVAYKQSVVRGEAKILSTISGGEARRYDISIEKVNYDKDNPSKNIVIRITDPELLKLTGGIVQGMSGSPIIQNGKLVGAVTHVFVNDPASGYGIFAENMLAQSRKITKSSVKKAS